MKKKRVIVFGVFDGVHDGHRNFFEQAMLHGDVLIAVVCRDKVAQQLKGKIPKYSEAQRRAAVEREPFIARAVLGDEILSTYEIVSTLQPDGICFGYDQQALQDDLTKWLFRHNLNIQTIMLQPWNPDTHRSSLLNS